MAPLGCGTLHQMLALKQSVVCLMLKESNEGVQLRNEVPVMELL